MLYRLTESSLHLSGLLRFLLCQDFVSFGNCDSLQLPASAFANRHTFSICRSGVQALLTTTWSSPSTSAPAMHSSMMSSEEARQYA